MEGREVRVCSVTGNEMSSGWCYKDGEEYYSTEEIALAEVQKRGYSSIQEAYDLGVIYYTEW